MQRQIQRTLFPGSNLCSQCIKVSQFFSKYSFFRSIGSKPYKFDLSPDRRKVVDGLISIFTQKRFDVETEELSQFGSEITHEIVENVLNEIKNWKVAYEFFKWAKTLSGFSHNCYTYNAMASILSTVRRNAPMKDLVFEVLECRCSMSPGALGFFIRCLGSVGLVEEANILFDQAREMGLCVPNNYTYNCLLETISKSSSSGSSSQAEMRVDEMGRFGWLIDRYTLTPLLQIYCNAGEFEKALSVFNQMFEMGCVDAHVLSILALSFSKWGEVDKAFELIERMGDHSLGLNEKTFYVLIHGFVSSSRVDKALQLFNKMRLSGFSPDIAIYDVLIGELCKIKEVKKAFALYSEMKNSGMFPDVGILKNLISSVGDEEVMSQLLEETPEDLDIEGLRTLYNSVLDGFVGHRLVDKAHHLLKMMLDDQIECDSSLEKFFKRKGNVCLNSMSFSIIINALCQHGRLDEALQLFRGMDCKKSVLLYNNLIYALSIGDRVADSLDLLTEMKESGFMPTSFTYNSIYGHFCRKADVIGAKSIIKDMRLYRHEPWIKHSTKLVKQLCEKKRVVEACNFLSEMVEEGFVPHLIPYSVAVDGLFKLHEVDQALELYHDILSRGHRPDVVACNILINGLCKAKRTSEAENVLKEMISAGLVPSTVTYNSLIDGWCKSGNIDKALEILSKMNKKHINPNVITFTTLIDGLCNVGRPDDAIKLWNEMEGKGYHYSPNRITFMAFISGLCKSGRPEIALFYLREMEKKKLIAESFVYVGLMDSLVSNKKPRLAFDVLKEIIDKELLPDPVEKNHALVKEAIAKLSCDPQTCSNVSTLVAEGNIPITFCSATIT